MKIKDGFMLRDIADSWIVVPLCEKVVEFNGMISLSESGALIWKLMENDVQKDDLVNELLKTYDVPRDIAEADVEAFIQKLEGYGIAE